MADFTIEAEPRHVTGKKVKTVRKSGYVPVSVYGPKTSPESLKIPYRALEIILRDAGGTNVIDLKVNGGKTHKVLARDVQRDVLKGTIMHVDFFALDMDAKIRADIPIHLMGTSPAVASREGILLTGTNTITIETLPDRLLNQIEIDLSQLKQVNDAITVADLDLGEGVEIINEPEEMIARVSQTSAARAELLEAMESGTEDEQVAAEPEVITKGKEEEEGEE